jgi:secreted Zn-dependent insulinase-like peptidase
MVLGSPHFRTPPFFGIPNGPRRRYEHRMLRSGLRVLLVEDPEAQKSSYAMAVEVGWGGMGSEVTVI